MVIINNLILGYYMSGIEDRLLVERLLNMHLVPFNLEPSERMKKLFLLFATVDENAGKAFIEVKYTFVIPYPYNSVYYVPSNSHAVPLFKYISIHILDSKASTACA